MHNKMIMNLVVPIGQVGFVFTDGADFESIKIGELNYLRLVASQEFGLVLKEYQKIKACFKYC